MLCGSHIKIWNLLNHMKKQNKNIKMLDLLVKNWKLWIWCSLFHFIHGRIEDTIICFRDCLNFSNLKFKWKRVFFKYLDFLTIWIHIYFMYCFIFIFYQFLESCTSILTSITEMVLRKHFTQPIELWLYLSINMVNISLEPETSE